MGTETKDPGMTGEPQGVPEEDPKHPHLERFQFIFDVWVLPFDDANPTSNPEWVTKEYAYEWVMHSLYELLAAIPVGKGKLMRVRFRGYQHEVEGHKAQEADKQPG